MLVGVLLGNLTFSTRTLLDIVLSGNLKSYTEIIESILLGNTSFSLK